MKENKNNFQINEKYLSGWLSPEALFTPANRDKYEQAAIYLEETHLIKPIFDSKISYKFIHGEKLLQLSGYIKFTYSHLIKNFYKSNVFFPQQMGYSKDLTDKQIDWLEANYFRMHNSQERYVKIYLHLAYNRK